MLLKFLVSSFLISKTQVKIVVMDIFKYLMIILMENEVNEEIYWIKHMTKILFWVQPTKTDTIQR